MNQADVYFKHWKILWSIYQDSELAINAPVVESSAKVSIEYAISVLEDIKEGYQFMSEDGVTGIPIGSITDRIKELKSIL
jgi:hypothetical protein